MAFAFAVNLPLTLAYEQPHSFGGFLGSLYHFVASLCMVAVQMLAPDGWRFNEMADGGLAWQSAVRSTLEGPGLRPASRWACICTSSCPCRSP